MTIFALLSAHIFSTASQGYCVQACAGELLCIALPSRVCLENCSKIKRVASNDTACSSVMSISLLHFLPFSYEWKDAT